MSQEAYFWDVRRNTFIMEWIPISIIGTVIGLSLYLAFCVILHVLLEEGFVIGDYLDLKFHSIDMIGLLFVALLVFFLAGRKTYRLMREKPFASISSEKLVLYFGKDSILWDHVQLATMESARKLTITFADNEKSKEKTSDLKWLSKKQDFIHKLKYNCDSRRIPYRETEMTFFSRINLYFEITRRFLFSLDDVTQGLP